MTRPVFHGRSSRIQILGTFGSCLLSVVLFGCAGELNPANFDASGITGVGNRGGGGAIGGSGGGAGGSGGGAMMGCADAPALFMTRCRVCHSTADSDMAGGGFDMETAGWEMGLLTKTPDATIATSECAVDMPTATYLMSGTNPATGLFLNKLKNPPPCGDRMPALPPALTAANLDCIQRWADSIANGGTGI